MYQVQGGSFTETRGGQTDSIKKVSLWKHTKMWKLTIHSLAMALALDGNQGRESRMFLFLT